LGINCGFGNTDCAALPIAALDLERRWLRFARPKTGVDRRVPLWRETVTALSAALATRHSPLATRHSPLATQDAGLVFITSRGQGWVREAAPGRSRCDAIAAAFAKLLAAAKCPGHGFYDLRRTCETEGGGAKDQIALDLIMGHVPPGMGTVYRQHVDDGRLAAVVEHIRRWLFGGEFRQRSLF
jgi:integrase